MTKWDHKTVAENFLFQTTVKTQQEAELLVDEILTFFESLGNKHYEDLAKIIGGSALDARLGDAALNVIEVYTGYCSNAASYLETKTRLWKPVAKATVFEITVTFPSVFESEAALFKLKFL